MFVVVFARLNINSTSAVIPCQLMCVCERDDVCVQVGCAHVFVCVCVWDALETSLSVVSVTSLLRGNVHFPGVLSTKRWV